MADFSVFEEEEGMCGLGPTPQGREPLSNPLKEEPRPS